MIALGIDPGLTGGVAALSSDGVLLFAERLPILRGQATVVDGRQLGRWVTALDLGPCHAWVERAQPMPRQGVSSGFNYGVGFGSLLGWLAALDIGYTLVPAARWKRAAGLSSDKAESIAMARQLWPTVELKKGEHGVAEAMLLANYGRTAREAA